MFGSVNKVLPNRYRLSIKKDSRRLCWIQMRKFLRLTWPLFNIEKLMHPASYAIDLARNKQIFSGPVYKLGEARNSENSC